MSDLVERLRAVDVSWSQVGEDCAAAADEIERLRKALAFYLTMDEEKPTSWKYSREKAEELARSVSNSSANLTSSVVKDCLTTDCATRRQIIDERDRTFALMLARAKNAERQLKALLRWTDALAITGSVTVEAWRELDKIATKAHKVLAGEK